MFAIPSLHPLSYAVARRSRGLRRAAVQRLTLVAILPGLVSQLPAAPSLVKLYDFNFPGPAKPNDSPLVINRDLWFTSESGGVSGFGTLSSFNLDSQATTVHVSMNNSTGLNPKATPAQDGDLLYFTTPSVGSVAGALSTWNMTTNSWTWLWSSPTTPSTSPNSLWGDVAIIDRGAQGKDVYFTTNKGGVGSAYGTIQRYQTNNGLTTQVHAFQGGDGRQPNKGFAAVGTDLYFLTFTGGTPNAGILGKVDTVRNPATDMETVTALKSMPGDSQGLGVHNPYYRAADHSLYFTLAGTSTKPGALMKFDLSTTTLTCLHEIQAANSGGQFPEGQQPYGSVAEWNNALYYTTKGGGTYDGGTINCYNLKFGTHKVLFHLDSDHSVNTANSLDNIGGEPRGGLVFNGTSTSPAFYLLCKQGGIHDLGTILQLNLDATPSAFETWHANFPGLTGLTSLTGVNALAAADPDGDGRSNLTEFAFGTSPTNGSERDGFSTAVTPGGLEIRWTARTDAGINYVVTGSPTLGAAPSPWTPVPQEHEVMNPRDIAVPADYERRRVVIPMDAANGYFRVEATILDTLLP